MAGARKVAIITGAARGIGAGVAQGLAKAGYTGAVVGLEGDLLRQKAREIGEGASAFEGDVTDRYSGGDEVGGGGVGLGDQEPGQGTGAPAGWLSRIKGGETGLLYRQVKDETIIGGGRWSTRQGLQ